MSWTSVLFWIRLLFYFFVSCCWIHHVLHLEVQTPEFLADVLGEIVYVVGTGYDIWVQVQCTTCFPGTWEMIAPFAVAVEAAKGGPTLIADLTTNESASPHGILDTIEISISSAEYDIEILMSGYTCQIWQFLKTYVYLYLYLYIYTYVHTKTKEYGINTNTFNIGKNKNTHIPWIVYFR